MSAEESDPETPLLQVIGPNATPEEVAALVAALASLGVRETPEPKPYSEWTAPHRRLRSFPRVRGRWASSI